MRPRSLASALLVMTALPALAETAGGEPAEPSASGGTRDVPARLSDVTIVGSSEAARDIGGAAHFIGPEELGQFQYADTLRVLKSVPGVYLQDE
ncbi:MAG: hypothetical protein P8080_13505 [Gammaproteobacteria bacterium]